MNKEEAKQKLHNLAFAKLNTKPDDLKLADVMQIVNQIDEPQKPVVPQCVADWIERRRKRREYSLLDAMHLTAQSEDFRKWIMSSKHQEVFVRAWLDGYEVEREKRYLVGIKGVSDNSFRLKYHPDTKRWIMGSNVNNSGLIAYHTRKELEEAGFGWVFDCSGVEVQEVQDDTKI